MPLDTLQSALSSVRAHTRKTLVHAHNIANAQTEGFRPLTVSLQSGPAGEVQANVGIRDAAEETDVVEETVGLMSSKLAIQANLAVLRGSEKTLGVLVDIVS